MAARQVRLTIAAYDTGTYRWRLELRDFPPQPNGRTMWQIKGTVEPDAEGDVDVATLLEQVVALVPWNTPPVGP